VIRAAALLLLLALWTPGAASADLRIRIDLSEQSMVVVRDGAVLHRWPVSTARPGKVTPTGTFRPQTMKRAHYSTLYDGAPMPHSIFFHGNYAIHGTTQTDRLGSPASAGCVRLHPANAERLFGYVLAEGKAATTIVIRR
jgi:lipoprotein-anchoring transpeptidase ErfK/SrfK